MLNCIIHSLTKTEQNIERILLSVPQNDVTMNKGFLQGFFSLRLILVPLSHIFQDISQFLFPQVLVLKSECLSTWDCSQVLTLCLFFYWNHSTSSVLRYENTLKESFHELIILIFWLCNAKLCIYFSNRRIAYQKLVLLFKKISVF